MSDISSSSSSSSLGSLEDLASSSESNSEHYQLFHKFDSLKASPIEGMYDAIMNHTIWNWPGDSHGLGPGMRSVYVKLK